MILMLRILKQQKSLYGTTKANSSFPNEGMPRKDIYEIGFIVFQGISA